MDEFNLNGELACGLTGMIENTTFVTMRYRLNMNIQVVVVHFRLHTKSISCLKVMRYS